MALEPLFPAEENNEVSWYTSGLAGIASGGIKVVEGAFSLGAELIDLGLNEAQIQNGFSSTQSAQVWFWNSNDQHAHSKNCKLHSSEYCLV